MKIRVIGIAAAVGALALGGFTLAGPARADALPQPLTSNGVVRPADAAVGPWSNLNACETGIDHYHGTIVEGCTGPDWLGGWWFVGIPD